MIEYQVSLREIQRKVAALFGDEVCLSYPLPDLVGETRVEKYFLYPMGNSLVRGRPFGLLTVSMESGAVLAYQDCRLADFVDTKVHPFSEKISYALPRKLGVKEYKLEQSLINKMYEAVRKTAFQTELTGQDKEVLEKYWVVAEAAMPVALVPYYQAMGKNFYAWGYSYV